MAEAWKAAQSYDPAKSKFSTWGFRPCCYTIKEFWRVKRLPTENLSASGNDSDNQTTLQDQFEDPDSPSPDEALGGLTPAEHLMTNSPEISTYSWH